MVWGWLKWLTPSGTTVERWEGRWPLSRLQQQQAFILHTGGTATLPVSRSASINSGGPAFRCCSAPSSFQDFFKSPLDPCLWQLVTQFEVIDVKSELMGLGDAAQAFKVN